MEGFKEFQGKDLDDAISRACAYFDVPREKLEVDIVQDSKSGIFGIVGARKAMVKARRVKTQNAFAAGQEAEAAPPAPEADKAERSLPGGGRRDKARTRTEPEAACATPAPGAAPARPKSAPRSEAPAAAEEDEEGESQTLFLNKMPPAPSYADIRVEMAALASPRKGLRTEGRGNEGREGRRRPPAAKKAPAEPKPREARRELFSAGDLKDFPEENEGLPEVPFEDLDHERLADLSLETVQRLIRPVTSEARCEVRLEDGRVYVGVDCDKEHSGILIGREGQTLAALQYLASRIVSRAMNASVRINLDTGSYRERQDDKLRELALSLAARTRSTGKPYSTRPLSSYHRRIIHLALQDDPEVQTRSTGEGALKRVVVQRRR